MVSGLMLRRSRSLEVQRLGRLEVKRFQRLEDPKVNRPGGQLARRSGSAQVIVLVSRKPRYLEI